MATAPNRPLGHCLPCPEKEVEPLGASAVKWPGTHQPLERQRSVRSHSAVRHWLNPSPRPGRGCIVCFAPGGGKHVASFTRLCLDGPPPKKQVWLLTCVQPDLTATAEPEKPSDSDRIKPDHGPPRATRQDVSFRDGVLMRGLIKSAGGVRVMCRSVTGAEWSAVLAHRGGGSGMPPWQPTKALLPPVAAAAAARYPGPQPGALQKDPSADKRIYSTSPLKLHPSIHPSIHPSFNLSISSCLSSLL
ncbi:hypothetical protein D4764_17G0003080 [Takifugu flavidus]|uniref:Uncharacterized protein n=1 Tax=Takifugu flavidus TaxID=433684 RepID=A0A5C6NV70_9TELE|nr:hypothetical protein D4764_17G0003080 [Takifugu flavidus]